MWSGETGDHEFATLSVVGETTVITAGANVSSLDPAGRDHDYTPFSSPVSDTRVWSDSEFMGICRPEEHRVITVRTAVNPANGRVILPGMFATTEIGSGIGQGPGKLLSPVSFDAFTDGRIYVLDAGNSRIQVFDEEGHYLTEWGTHGNDAGEFDFLPIGDVNFAGSIAVDDDGFIYVADVGNRRIQKFAP